MKSQCDNSNPHYDCGGYFGYTEKFGNHPGGQAKYLKVPFGNFTPFVNYLDYRINHAKKMNKVEVFEFTKYPDMGEHLKEITHGGADVVIDCVGMDGKKSPLEYLEQKFKLQDGTLGPIQISTKAVRKYGTVQMTGVYGGNYNLFPLGAFWIRNN